MKHCFILLLLAFGILVGCDKTQIIDQDIRGDGNQHLDKTELIVFPTAGDPSLINPMTIPTGNYRLVTFSTITTNSKIASRALLTRTLLVPGEIQEGDSLFVKTDWKDSAQISKDQKLGAELNLPLTIGANGTALEFQNRHYYAHFSHPDGQWRWRNSGKISESGFRFHEILPSGPLTPPFLFEKDGVKSNNKLAHGRLASALNGTEFLVTIEAKFSEDEQFTAQFLYRRM